MCAQECPFVIIAEVDAMNIVYIKKRAIQHDHSRVSKKAATEWTDAIKPYCSRLRRGVLTAEVQRRGEEDPSKGLAFLNTVMQSAGGVPFTQKQVDYVTNRKPLHVQRYTALYEWTKR